MWSWRQPAGGAGFKVSNAAAMRTFDAVGQDGHSATVSATRAAGLLTIAGIGVGAANLLFNVLVARSGGVAAYGGTGALLAFGTGAGFLALGLQYGVARRIA